MKKSYLLPLVVSIGLFSCTKSGTDTTSGTGANTNKTSYKVNGVVDVSIQNNPDSNTSVTTLTITDTLKSAQKITLSLDGLPNGVTGTLSNTSGYPTYTSVLTFVDASNATPGVYPIKLNCEGSISGKASYTINLTVRADHDYANDWIGTADAITRLVNGDPGPSFTETITHGDRPNRVVFHNFFNDGVDVYADIRPDGENVDIPSQTINGAIYSGGLSTVNDPSGRHILGGRVTRTTNGNLLGYDIGLTMR
ncbi:hypothetical protein [Taibaiella soli]|uniref:Uncharacterized protein n=1 Tax=Taibaiella soli TaxID=1649169 RepID=A0A2W2B888_9BACT|nr:hypothetical protein [Taibaiella soli]PZF72489.1 hypothetical protein DN068_11530 [Taibaiella soli]